MSALRNLEPGAVLALVGATVLMAVGLDFSARNDACEGALVVADAMEAQGVAIAARLDPEAV